MGGYDNRNSRERNKNEIVLLKKLSLLRAPIDQNALRFSQMQYDLLKKMKIIWRYLAFCTKCTRFSQRQMFSVKGRYIILPWSLLFHLMTMLITPVAKQRTTEIHPKVKDQKFARNTAHFKLSAKYKFEASPP